MPSNVANVLAVRESRGAVWNVSTGQWDPMQQPILNAGSVTIPGTITVVDGGGSITVDGTFFQATQPVSIAATIATKETRAATPTQTTVADSATNVTILASNANRLGATIENDSSAVLYLKLGATATTTSYSARLVQYSYYEVPFNYTGIIDGIWASDPGDGAARVTELVA